MCHLQVYRRKLHFVERRVLSVITRVKMWAATKIVSSRLGLGRSTARGMVVCSTNQSMYNHFKTRTNKKSTFLDTVKHTPSKTSAILNILA